MTKVTGLLQATISGDFGLNPEEGLNVQVPMPLLSSIPVTPTAFISNSNQPALNGA